MEKSHQNMKRTERGYTIGNHQVLDICKRFGTPLYLYDAEVIRERIAELRNVVGLYPRTEFLYAVKANYNPHLVRLIVSQGFGIDAVSVEEVRLALSCGCPKDRILFTENNITDEEMRE